MRLKNLVLPLFVVLLTACGGGGDDEDSAPVANSIGVFTNGPITGVRYTTPTVEGLTNAAGEFEYKEGETVTFSIGDVVLGSTTGASEITVFDFFGITPPTTQKEFNRITRSNPFYSSSRLATGFDKAINISSLLVALDTDRNPQNGFDIGNADSTIVGNLFNFDAPFDRFVGSESTQLFATRNNIAPIVNTNFNLLDSLTIDNREVLLVNTAMNQLYDALGINNFNASLSVSAEREVNGVSLQQSILRNVSTGEIDSIQTDSDADGNLDTTITFITVEQATATGEIIEIVSEPNVNEVSVRLYATIYDDRKNLIISNEKTSNFGSDPEELETLIQYDSQDRITTTTTTTEDDDDIILAKSTTTFDYDSFNNIVTELTTKDDGTAEKISYTYTYDENGLELSKVQETDNDNDATINAKITTTKTYDGNGNTLTLNRVTDSDNNGVVDEETNTVKTFNANNQVLSESIVRITDGLVISESTDTSTYNDDGKLLTSRYVNDSDGNSIIDVKTLRTYEYDTNGYLVKVTKVDEMTGTITEITEFTYDEDGNMVSYLSNDIPNNEFFRSSLVYKTFLNVKVSELRTNDAGGTLNPLLFLPLVALLLYRRQRIFFRQS